MPNLTLSKRPRTGWAVLLYGPPPNIQLLADVLNATGLEIFRIDDHFSLPAPSVVGDLSSSEEIAWAGAAVPAATPIFVKGQTQGLRVRFPPESRASLDAINNTVLTSSDGHTATLGSLATVTELLGQTEIICENLKCEVAVTARRDGVDLGTGVSAFIRTVDELKLPSSIRVVYGGARREQQRPFHDLLIVLLLALMLVFLVLLFEFRSFGAPVAILSSAILSTSGICLALLLTRSTFNITSFMGLTMVVGIVAKNGITVLDADQRFRPARFSSQESMVQASRRHLRAIAMRALAAVPGMLPLALAFGTVSPTLQPLAITVIGGIEVSMILSLVITPAVHFYLTRAGRGPLASS